jgi:hypothetical protein
MYSNYTIYSMFNVFEIISDHITIESTYGIGFYHVELF